MRIQLLLAVALLYPALAGAGIRYDADDPATHLWLGIGFGGGSIESTAPAPAAGHDAFGASIDGGYRFGPQWGLGLEWGLTSPQGGCGGHHCTSASADFAPNFTHWSLISEYRPNDSGLRLRAGVGVSSMCYRQYKGGPSGWDWLFEILGAALSGDSHQDYEPTGTSWKCKNASTLGTSLSIGYQWSLPRSLASVGLQLRGEAANFAASAKAGTPSFHHRAMLMQVQLNLD